MCRAEQKYHCALWLDSVTQNEKLVRHAVLSERVSTENSVLDGNLQGIFAQMLHRRLSDAINTPNYRGFLGKFPKCISREF